MRTLKKVMLAQRASEGPPKYINFDAKRIKIVVLLKAVPKW